MATIRHLETSGWSAEGHELLITNLLTLAEAVDAHPERAILRKEYREAAEALLKTNDRVDGAVIELFDGMSRAVGDAETTGA